MKNINVVQVVLIGISTVAIIGAVVMFAIHTAKDPVSANGTVVLWGTLPEESFSNALRDLSNDGIKIDGLEYVEKDPTTLNNDLLNAIVEGTAPDLVLLDEKQVIENQKRMMVIPYTSFPLRDYQDTFIDESSLYLTDDGIIGFPFLVDPLVMFYNKDILANAGYSKPPQTWAEVLAVTPTLTQKDSSFNISKSTIALGAFSNIHNAKDIFWTLTLQAGNPVIQRTVDPDTQLQVYESVLDSNLNYTLNPTYAATNFFTQFSNPTKTIYSWNQSLPDSRTSFIAGDLAFYLGHASELAALKQLNPNLNFDMTLVPQSQSSTRKITYGTLYTLVIPRATTNTVGVMNVIKSLTSTDAQNAFVKEFEIGSVRKDVLAEPDPESPYQKIINRSAIIAQGVLEPNESQTSDLIKELIDSVVSGQLEISTAVKRADEKLTLLLPHESN